MTRDFIYNQVLTGCLNAGVSQALARNAATYAAECYAKGRYKGKVSAFIIDQIKQAKKRDR